MQFPKKHYIPTDRPMDRPTDQQTDTPSYRDARTHLKSDEDAKCNRSDCEPEVGFYKRDPCDVFKSDKYVQVKLY